MNGCLLFKGYWAHEEVDLWVGHHGDELALHLDEHVASLEAGLVGGRVDPQHLLHLEGSGSS